MQSLVFCVILAFFGAVYANEAIMNECTQQVGATPGEVEELSKFWTNSDVEPSQKLGCWAFCVSEKTGLMDMNGVNREFAQKEGKELKVTPEILKKVDDCFAAIGKEEKCAMGAKLSKCMKESGAIHYLD